MSQLPASGNQNKKQSRNGRTRKEFSAVPLTDEKAFPNKGAGEERRNWNKCRSFPQVETEIKNSLGTDAPGRNFQLCP